MRYGTMMVAALATVIGTGQLSAANPPATAARALTPAETAQAVVKGSNQFMCDLYAKLAARQDDVFFSPYAMSSALALLERGARGKTDEELRAALHLPRQDETVNAVCSEVAAEMQAEKQGYRLAVANGIWTQQGEPFQPAFLNDATKVFHAGLEALNFIADTEPSRAKINAWISGQTADKIKELLPAGAVTRDSRLVVTSAVYFKGTWACKFKKTATLKEDFHLATRKTVKTELMHQSESFNYASDDNCQVVELPYKGAELAMLVLLPVKTDLDCQKLEAGLNADYIRGAIDQLGHRPVILTLPKWKFGQSYDMTPPLQELGITQAFDDKADFSGINGRKELRVSAVVHRADIDVNEEFTEATAGTAVVSGAAGGVGAPEPPVVFRADRPFVYLIYHRVNRTVLFMGRLTNPTAK